MNDQELSTPRALQRYMRAEFALNDEQFAAATSPLVPSVVIAGAGSGKTTLMAARVAWLVGTGQVQPHEVLGLTFTTKAAAELRERVRKVLAPTPAGSQTSQRDSSGSQEGQDTEVLDPTISTYHAYASRLLSEHGLRIGHEPSTRVIADASRYQLATRVISRHRRPVELLSDHPPTVATWLLGLDAQLAEHLVTPQQLRAYQEAQTPLAEAAVAAAKNPQTAPAGRLLHTFARRTELLGLVEEYRQLKAELGLMEFSDQIELAARLAHQRPEVGHAERASYKVVLLDEYQDTSVAQALMLSRLFSGPDAPGGRGHAVMAVGDPNQAIYGWRGASVSNIVRFADSFPARHGQVSRYSLTTNRRSGAHILALANDVVTGLPQVGGKDLLLVPDPQRGTGHVRDLVFPTVDDEYDWLTQEVEAAHGRVSQWRQIAVLVRDNRTGAAVYERLTQAGVPVEIVGLQGLLALPEVREIVATLRLLQDLSANADLLTLLTGPRWAIGPRDLALLGARSRELAATGASNSNPRGHADSVSVAEELNAAVAGVDPVEIVSLCEALDNPGDGATLERYSTEARERFALLSAELRRLRAHAGEPMLDLVRRIIDTCGLEVELAASTSPAAASRLDNVDLFVRAVADFQAIDNDSSLSALLAYLGAEEDDTGLDQAVPTPSDSLKLLTVHRAKGLEFDAVFCVGVAEKKFPSQTSRGTWVTTPSPIPNPLRGDAGDLPVLAGYDKTAFEAYTRDCKAYALREETRLAYVAFTRPRAELWVSSHHWSSSRKDPLGPSVFQRNARDFAAAQGWENSEWPTAPAKGEANPLLAVSPDLPWPRVETGPETARRQEAASWVRRTLTGAAVEGVPLSVEEAALVAEWDKDLARLVAEADERQRPHLVVPRPEALTVTALQAFARDPATFARRIARPMPRQPSAAARFGVRFHSWVEAYFTGARQELLFDLDDLAGRADVGVGDERDLKELIAAFETGPLAQRRPLAVEAPFSLMLGTQVVRGQLDAVFADSEDLAPGALDGGALVVDWKTNRNYAADPLQLALYRLAWAELAGVDVSHVRAGFYYVRSGTLEVAEDLPDRADLTELLTARG